MSDSPTTTPRSENREEHSSPPTEGELSAAFVPEDSTLAATTAYAPDAVAESAALSPNAKRVLPAVPGYEILSILGRGGMGVVYRARQIKANRVVALKMILSGSYAAESELARFRSEAESIARLQHPHIVQVFEVGEHEGQPFFSLEFCGGGSLARHLHGTPLPPREAARLVEILADAIHAAHQKGIVHRDLKPANILLSSKYEEQSTKEEKYPSVSPFVLGSSYLPKVADFGLAKSVEDAGQTASGVVMGTPSYIAPEQASGDIHHIGPAADIYALGAILYELLTGRPPFRAATPMETILQVLHEEPVPPRQLQPKTPRDVETICLKCLHKDASRRYAAAADLAADLGRFARGEPIQARPVGWVERAVKWVRRRPAAASLLAVAAALPPIALLLAGWYLERQRQFNEDLQAERNTALEQKGIAERNAETAKQREKEANEQKKLAQEATRDSQLRLVQMHVATGVRLMEDGDALTALPWLVAALREDPSAEATREMHRYRIAALLRQSPRLVRMFLLRPIPIGAEFSPDGRNLLTAGSDGSARVWNIATGRAFPPPPRQSGSISSVVFSPDGRLALTADRDRYAKVWVATTGQVIATLKHNKHVNAACFSPDGRRVLTASNDETARIWDAHTGQPLGQPLQPGAPVLHAVFSPDGRLVATASSNTARIWDALTGKPLGPALPHGGAVQHLAFSPDGTRIVSASRDNRVRVWEVATGKLVFTLSHGNVVYKAFFSPDGDRLVSCSLDFTARLWNAATGQPIGQPLKHGAAVYHVSFSPDGSRVVTTGEDLTARVWNARTGELAVPPLKHPQVVETAAFGPDGRLLATCCRDGIVRVWELAGDAPAFACGFQDKFHRLSPDTRLALTVAADGTARFWSTSTGRASGAPWRIAAVRHAEFSSDSRRIIVACADQTARVWDVAEAREACAALKHGQPVTAAFLSDDGRRAATCCADQTVHVWNLSDGREVCPPLPHPGQPYHVQFSGDGRRVVTASRSGPGKAHLWDVATGRPLGAPLINLPLESGYSYADIGPALSPTGDRVATRVGDFAGRIWDATTGQALGPLLKHNGGVSFLCFSPDGRRVLSTSNDCTAGQWDADTGRPITPALRHLHWVRHGAYSPDSRLLATAGFDYRTRLWDSATGLPLALPWKNGNHLDRVRFSPDGLRLLNWNTSNLVAWKVPRSSRPVEDLLKLTNLLAGHQLDANGGLVPLTQDESARIWQDLSAKYPQDFRFSPIDLPALHLQKANQFSNGRKWTDAVHHYDKAIELGVPNLEAAWSGRAYALAQLQQWDKALADLLRYRARRPEQHYVWFQIAPLLLRTGDVKGHRRHCQEMLQRFGRTQDPSVAEHVAKACLLHAGSAEEIDPAARLMTWVLRVSANHRDRFYFEVTKGLADYRQGQFRAAEQHLDKFLQGRDKLHWSVLVPGHLVLAMAQHRQGRTEKARETLKRASRLMEEQIPQFADAKGNWLDWLICQLLHEEAEELLKAQP